MNFLKVASRDIKSIMKNRFIRVSVVAIIIVPLLYSLLYLYAFWDPYSKLDKMKVAVVNQDKGTLKDGSNVNFGNDMVNNLKNNHQVGWTFVDYETAQKGLEGKDYYALFLIPEDFSQKVLSAKDGAPTPPKIKYVANEKKNFLAAQVNGKVMLELKQELVKGISKEYTKITFDNLYELKDGMIKAADGSKKLNDGIEQAAKGSSELNSGALALRDGSKQLSDGLSTAVSGVGKVTGVVEKNQDLLKLIQDKNTIASARSLTATAEGLGKADTSMLKIVPQVMTPGNMALFNRTEKDLKAANIPALLSSNAVSTGKELMTPQNQTNLNKIMLDSKELSQVDMSKFNALLPLLQPENAAELKSLLTNAGTLTSLDTAGISSFVTNQIIAADEYSLHADALTKAENTAALKAAIDTAYPVAGGEAAAAANAKLKALVDGYAGLTSQTSANMQSSKNYMENSLVPTLTSLGKVQQQFVKDAPMLGMLQGALTPENLAYYNAVFLKLNTMQQDLKNSSDTLAKTTALMTELQKPELLSSIGKLQALEKDMQDAAPVITAISQSMGPNAMNSLASAPQLVNDLLTAQKNLQNNEKILQVVNSALEDGNIETAKGLINQLPQLTTGINALYDGAYKLNSGLNTLYAGTNTLQGGMTQLKDGSGELYSKLQEGSDKISGSLINSSEDMAEFVSAPLTMEEKPLNPVKNYGIGFAPYFIPLSLWVGAIMMFFIITDKTDDDIKAGPVSLVLGKFLSYGYIGIIQAVLASVIVLALGLSPQSVPLYFAFNILLSFTFIAIIQCLVFLMGQVGRLLSIILLILQLTSCAGTFPIEVVPKFFRILNPIMPFTYGVSGLREAISGVDYSVFMQDAGILLMIMVAFIAISVIFKERADRVQNRIKELKDSAETV